MRDLLIIDFEHNQYGVWEDELLCCAKTRYISHLPMLPDYIAGICSIEKGHSITLADLRVCIGLPAAKPQDTAQALLLSEDKNFAGFCVYGEIEKIPVTKTFCHSIPEYLATEVINESIILDQTIIPIINVQNLFKRLLNKHYSAAKIEACLPYLNLETFTEQLSGAHFFTCGNEMLACPAERVESVIPLFRRLVELPNAPSYIAGMIEHHKRLIPVIDLACWLQITVERTSRTLLIVSLDGHDFGFLIEQDYGIKPEKFTLHAYPELLSWHCLQQAILVKKHIIPLIDFNLLVTSPSADQDNHFPLKPQFYSNASTPIKFTKTEIKIVPFSLLGLNQAIPKDEVKDILPVTHYQIPIKKHSFIQGVIYYENQLLPIIDLANCFGRHSIVSDDWKMILVENGNFKAFILAESVENELTLSVEQQQKLPFELEYPVVYGCYTDGSGVDLILNIEAIITHADQSIVKQFFDSYSQKINRNTLDTVSKPLHEENIENSLEILADIQKTFDEWDNLVSDAQLEEKEQNIFDLNDGEIEHSNPTETEVGISSNPLKNLESFNKLENHDLGLKKEAQTKQNSEKFIESEGLDSKAVSRSELDAFEQAVQLATPLDESIEKKDSFKEIKNILESNNNFLPVLEDWVEESAKTFDQNNEQNVIEDALENNTPVFSDEKNLKDDEFLAELDKENSDSTSSSSTESDEEIFEGDEFLTILEEKPEQTIKTEDFSDNLKENQDDNQDDNIDAEEIFEGEEFLTVLDESESKNEEQALIEETAEDNADSKEFLTVLDESESKNEEQALIEETAEDNADSEEFLTVLDESESKNEEQALIEETAEDNADSEEFLTVLDESESKNEEQALIEETAEDNADSEEFLTVLDKSEEETLTDKKIDKSIESENFSTTSNELIKEKTQITEESTNKNEENEEFLAVSDISIDEEEKASNKKKDATEKNIKNNETLNNLENDSTEPQKEIDISKIEASSNIENITKNNIKKTKSNTQIKSNKKVYYTAGISIILFGATYYWLDNNETIVDSQTPFYKGEVSLNDKQVLAKKPHSDKQNTLKTDSIKNIEVPVSSVPIETPSETINKTITTKSEPALTVELPDIKAQTQTFTETNLEEKKLQLTPEELEITEDSPSAINEKTNAEFEAHMILPEDNPAIEKDTQQLKKCTSIEYTIKKGETLWSIAERFTGSGFNYKKIARYNGIKNVLKTPSGATIVIKDVKNVWCVKEIKPD